MAGWALGEALVGLWAHVVPQILFVGLSIALAAVAVETTGADEISSTLDRNVAPAPADPLGGVTGGDGAPADGASTSDDPLAGATE